MPIPDAVPVVDRDVVCDRLKKVLSSPTLMNPFWLLSRRIEPFVTSFIVPCSWSALTAAAIFPVEKFPRSVLAGNAVPLIDEMAVLVENEALVPPPALIAVCTCVQSTPRENASFNWSSCSVTSTATWQFIRWFQSSKYCFQSSCRLTVDVTMIRPIDGFMEIFSPATACV